MSFPAPLFRFLPLLLLVAACRKAPQVMTQAQLNRYIDSAAQAQLVDRRAEAAVQLERRLAIEAKPRADSIVEALSQPQSVRDSLQQLRDRSRPDRNLLHSLTPGR